MATANPRLNAGLGLVTGIAVDHSGNVYFNDPDNHVVFRVGADGIIHVIAGQRDWRLFGRWWSSDRSIDRRRRNQFRFAARRLRF